MQKENIFNYYIKRFAKIYPVYILGTIVYFICYTEEFLKSPLRVILNDIFLVQSFFPSMFEIGLNGGTWSLTVEMFLYFLFPFLMILLNKNAKTSILFGISIILLVTLNIKLNQSDNIYSNPIFRLGDFMIGIGTCFMCNKFIKNNKNLKILHLFSILFLFFTVVFLSNSKYQYMLGQFIIAPLFGLYIFSIYHSKNFIYNNQVIIYLGKISYSFYIWQFFAIKFGKYLMQFNIINNSTLNIHLVALLSFILNIIISIISYHCIEEPFRKIIIIHFTEKYQKSII